MKLLLSLGAWSAALLMTAVSAQAAVSSQDQVFATHAAQGGMGEVQAAKIALQKTHNPTVRAFAQKMVTDHSKANAQLTAIIKANGLTPPATVGQADQTMADQLSSLSGAAFDSAYLKGQEVSHKQTIALFQKEVASGATSPFVTFAKQTLPTVKMHYAMVTKDVASMSSGAKTSSM